MAIKELKGINKRPRYFAGQYLLEDDFELQQDYSRDRLQRITRSLHVSGIADGLIVTKPNDSSLKLIVYVSAGTAIDPQGRQVVLHESRLVDLTKNLVEEVTLNNGDYILYIGYDEQESEPQDENPSTNRRILEDPIFKLSLAATSDDFIAIAKLTIKDGIVAISSDSSVRKYTGLRLPALENAPTLRSKGGNLAVFSGSLEIAGSQTVGSTTLESHLYLSGATGRFAQFYRDAIDGKDYLGIEAFKQDDSTTKTAIVLQEFGGNVGIGGAPASGANGEKLKVAGNTTIAGTLSVTDTSTLNGNTTIAGTLSVIGANGNLTVAGTSMLNGNTAIAGTLNITSSNNSQSAYLNAYMAPGSLRIGDIDSDYGGGQLWTSNTAGLLLVTKENTEIAVCDYNERVASLMYYEGGAENKLTIGRNMGWGAISTVAVAGTLSVTGTSTLNGNTTIAGTSTLRGNVGVGGDPGSKEKLKVTGDAAIAGALTVVMLDVEGAAMLGYESDITDDLGSPLKSGFYQINGRRNVIRGNVPDQHSDWTHLITARHSNKGNNHQLQIAANFAKNDRLFFRKIAEVEAGAENEWNEVATRKSNLFIGDQKIEGNTTLAGTLSVTGTSTLNGNTTIAGTSTLRGQVGVGGDPGSTEKLKVTGDAAIVGTFSTTGNVGIGTTEAKAQLQVIGTVNITSSNFRGNYANPKRHMAAGSLTIGSIDQNYGGGMGWHSSTAGLLLETSDNTEIAVHDAGTRLASFMHYEGAQNRFTIGRNMGFGAISTVAIEGNLSVNALTCTDKPIQMKKILGSVSNNGQDIDTGYSSNTWICSVAGFTCDNGDIYEQDAGMVINVSPYKTTNSNWFVQVNFRVHKRADWTIWILAIKKDLATTINC